MVTCESTDINFPMLVDIYYPIVEQSAYGNVKKEWILDKTIACRFAPEGLSYKEDIKPNVAITQDSVLVGRVKTDIRISKHDSKNAMTNIIFTNIKTASGQFIFTETAGPRSGSSTIYEVATFEPFVNPFGDIEYYKVVLRRSENQGVDL
jgi:hypothetical protein